MVKAASRLRPQDYDVSLQALSQAGDLGVAWRELQARSRCSFFLSWAWIGLWLELICDPRIARVISVRRHSRLVALGIVTARRRFYGLGPRHLRLHEVGKQDLDNLTIEYNGLLCETGHEQAAMTAAVAHLAEADRRWLTFHAAGVCVEDIDFEALDSGRMDVRTRLRATHYIDLDALRARGVRYADALAPKTRSTLRRTERRLADAFGPVTLEVARSAEQRVAFFRELVPLHERYWTGKAGSGAFADPRIVAFHERLIAASGDDAGATLYRLRAGDGTVGVLYNLLWRGRSYYYQAGIDYARFDDIGSPGLLLIAQAVQHALDAGHARFELMAGDAMYKRKLGTAQGRMAWVYVDRIGLLSRARQIWWSFLRGTPK